MFRKILKLVHCSLGEFHPHRVLTQGALFVNILVQRSFRGRFFPAVPAFPAVPTFPVILAVRSFRLSGPSSFLVFLVNLRVVPQSKELGRGPSGIVSTF